jgi:hypothetical protein
LGVSDYKQVGLALQSGSHSVHCGIEKSCSFILPLADFLLLSTISRFVIEAVGVVFTTAVQLSKVVFEL